MMSSRFTNSDTTDGIVPHPIEGTILEVAVTAKQYSALMDIYGPPENVHYMIVLARMEKDGSFVLEGETEDFEQLLSLISEEIGEGLCSKTNARLLLNVCKKVDPASLDWIGF